MKGQEIKVLQCKLWIRGTEEGINGKVVYRYTGMANSFEFNGEEILAKINGHEVDADEKKPGLYHLNIVNPEISLPAAEKKLNPIPLQIRKSLEYEDEQNVLEIEFVTNAKESGSGLIKRTLGEDKLIQYTATEVVLLPDIIPCLSNQTIRLPYDATFVIPKEWDVVFSGHEKEILDYEAHQYPPWVTEDLEDWLDEELEENFNWAKVVHFKVLQQEACPYSLFFCFGDILEVEPNIWAVNKKLEPRIPIIQEVKFKVLEWIKSFLDMPISSNKLKLLIIPGLECTVRHFYSLCLIGEKEMRDTVEDQSILVQSLANRIIHQLFGHCVTVKTLSDLLLIEGICQYLSQQFYEANKKNFSFTLFSGNLLKLSARNSCLQKDQLLSVMIDEGEPSSEVVKCLVDRCAIVVNMLGVGLGHPETIDLLKEVVHKFKWQALSRKAFQKVLLERCALIENGSRKDFVTRWWDDWLETTGTNTLTLEIKPNGIIVSQNIGQGSGDRLRMHFLSLMFLDKEGNLIGTKTFTIKAIAQCRLVHSWLKVTAAIVPNSDGDTYARVLLDTDSFIYLRENLNKVLFKMPRIMVYQTFFDHVLSLSMSPKQFCKMVVAHFDSLFSREYQEKIINEFFWPVFNKYLKSEHQKQVSHNFFQLCLSLMPKKQLHGPMATFMIRCCLTKPDIARLVEMLDLMDETAKGKKEFYTLVVMKTNANEAIDDSLKQNLYDRFADLYEKTDPEALKSLNTMLSFSAMTPAEKRIELYDSLVRMRTAKRTNTKEERDNSYYLYLETFKVIPEFLEDDQLEEYLEYIRKLFLKHLAVLHTYLKDLIVPSLGKHASAVIAEVKKLIDTDEYKQLTRSLKITFGLIVSDLELASRWQNMKADDPQNIFGDVENVKDLLVGRE